MSDIESGVHGSPLLFEHDSDYDDPLRTSGSSDEEPPPPQKPLDMRELFRRKSGDKRLLSDSCPRERLHTTPKRFRMGAERSTSENRVTSRSEPVTQRSKKLTNGSQDGEVMSVLQEITGVLNTLVKRVESTEKEIKGVKIKLESSSMNSSTSDSTTKRKEAIPLVVRVRN